MNIMLMLMVACLRLHNPIGLTIDEIDQMNRVVMSEAGGESAECQEAVATVIINRAYSDKFPNTVSGVLAQKKQFSFHNNGEPTTEVKLSVLKALMHHGTDEQIINRSAYYFRRGTYHNFGIPETHIDNTYFSLAEDYVE